MDLLACEHCQDMPKELGVSENGLYTPARAILIGKLMIMMIQWMESGFLIFICKNGIPYFSDRIVCTQRIFPTPPPCGRCLADKFCRWINAWVPEDDSGWPGFGHELTGMFHGR